MKCTLGSPPLARDKAYRRMSAHQGGVNWRVAVAVAGVDLGRSGHEDFDNFQVPVPTGKV